MVVPVTSFHSQLAIPMASMTTNFDPTFVWHANFYRVEGSVEPRAYYAWQPTNTYYPLHSSAAVINTSAV